MPLLERIQTDPKVEMAVAKIMRTFETMALPPVGFASPRTFLEFIMRKKVK